MSITSDALVTQLGLADGIVDAESRNRAIVRFREQRIVLPTFAQLADPATLEREQACATDGQPITGDQLDSTFYFSQHFQAVRDVFQNAQSTDRIETLWGLRPMNYGTLPAENGTGLIPAETPVNFIDNHDVARFLFWIRDRPIDEQRALLHNTLLAYRQRTGR